MVAFLLQDNGFNIKIVVKPFESNIFNLRSDAQGSSIGTEMTLGEWRSQQGASQIHIYYWKSEAN